MASSRGRRNLSEKETRRLLIDPALEKVGWTDEQIHLEYPITAGKVVAIGSLVQRSDPKYADYLLSYKPDLPIAVIEAKDTSHSVGAGLQQGMGYAQTLHVPFAYSSNGYGFVEHDYLTGRERTIPMEEFPTARELWDRYCEANGLLSPEARQICEVPYHYDHDAHEPRYYQRIAINETLQAVATGNKRILLVMATGTGKTFTAFQIVHRMRSAGLARKVLYLADRNILIDQTKDGDFKPLQKVVTKIEHRKLDPSYEVYFSLYQQLIGENQERLFEDFSPDFFDLIIVDECHRGSAKEDSAWRAILEYFDSAIQVGMTATPKETKDVSNIDYFGEPLFIYSLRQGIEDGFLAPFKVVRVNLDVDTYGVEIEGGTIDTCGEDIPEGIYGPREFDRVLVLEERTKLVAKRITQFLKETDRFAKTIVFCQDIEHAERMRRELINENADIVKDHPNYVVQITGDQKGVESQIDLFTDPDELYPTIVTTSKLLTTGVNCKTCKVIVLDNIFGDQGMTEFKQIIGRGTRIAEDYDKLYFTILDFRNASRMFADPQFDGEPVQIYEPRPGQPLAPPSGQDDGAEVAICTPAPPPDTSTQPEFQSPRKYYVDDVEVSITHERVEYYTTDGTLVTESLRDYTRKNILGEYDTLDHFLIAWKAKDRKQVIIEELKSRGVFLDELRKESGQHEMSDFDLICHVAFDARPLTRSERVKNVKKRGYLHEYEGVARDVLEALLDKYATSNLVDLEDTRVLSLKEFRKFGGPVTIVRAFGGKESFIQAAQRLEDALYAA